MEPENDRGGDVYDGDLPEEVSKKTRIDVGRMLAYTAQLRDQVRRRLLLVKTIPHKERVFLEFEDYTRWLSKGKAGPSVELGVPLSILDKPALSCWIGDYIGKAATEKRQCGWWWMTNSIF